MGVLTRELASIFFHNFTTYSSFDPTVLNSSSIDMKIDTSRERSVSSSTNSSRESSTQLNASSISYYEKMEIQNHNVT